MKVQQLALGDLPKLLAIALFNVLRRPRRDVRNGRFPVHAPAHNICHGGAQRIAVLQFERIGFAKRLTHGGIARRRPLVCPYEQVPEKLSPIELVHAEHHLTDIVESEWQGNKNYSIEIELWFEGDAVLLRDGLRYDVRWSRPTRESLISLYTLDGEPMPLNLGNTWFQVFPLPEQQEADETVTIE